MHRCQLTFESISVVLTQRTLHGTRTKTIINDLSGVFLPSRLSVILGVSGSGKSTLLNAISGNGAALQNTEVTGNVYVNGEMLAQGWFVSQISGFVQQDDQILATMTVQEACYQSAQLRRSDLSQDQKIQVIDQVLQVLQLDKVKSQRVGGSEQRGISGGQRKRLSIAMEIIADPPVLFLDECTSGLDASMALMVIQMLKRLAEEGRTVITTLHQPSSQIMQLVDDLLVLADGLIVYHGPQESMQPYFESMGYQFPEKTNPADYLFIDIMEGQSSGTEDSTEQHRIWLAEVYFQSSTAFWMSMQAQQGPQNGISPPMVKKFANLRVQTKFMFRRLARNLYRTKGSIFIRVLTTIGLATFISLVFLNLGRKQQDPSNIYRSLSGAMFLVLINQVFVSFNSVLTSFGSERVLFQREYSAGYYGTLPYFLAKVFIELPFQLIFPVILTLIVYWTIGFRPGFEHYLVFTMFVVLISLFGAALGLAVATLLKREELATIVGPLFLLPLVIFGGYFVTISLVPVWLQWIQWVSPLQYAFNGMATDQFAGRVIQGVPGTTQLDQIGSSNNFPIGVNAVFVLIGVFVCLILAYIGLLLSVKSSGIRRGDVLQKRRQVLGR